MALVLWSLLGLAPRDTCLPSERYALVTFYEFPPYHAIPGAEAERKIDVRCTRAELELLKAEYTAHGIERGESWECNFIGPTMVRGFELSPWLGLRWTETEPGR